jgi:hypothetical protein
VSAIVLLLFLKASTTVLLRTVVSVRVCNTYFMQSVQPIKPSNHMQTSKSSIGVCLWGVSECPRAYTDMHY